MKRDAEQEAKKTAETGAQQRVKSSGRCWYSFFCCDEDPPATSSSSSSRMSIRLSSVSTTLKSSASKSPLSSSSSESSKSIPSMRAREGSDSDVRLFETMHQSLPDEKEVDAATSLKLSQMSDVGTARKKYAESTKNIEKFSSDLLPFVERKMQLKKNTPEYNNEFGLLHEAPPENPSDEYIRLIANSFELLAICDVLYVAARKGKRKQFMDATDDNPAGNDVETGDDASTYSETVRRIHPDTYNFAMKNKDKILQLIQAGYVGTNPRLSKKYKNLKLEEFFDSYITCVVAGMFVRNKISNYLDPDNVLVQQQLIKIRKQSQVEIRAVQGAIPPSRFCCVK